MEVLEKGEKWNIEVRCNGDGNGGAGCNSLLKVFADDFFRTKNTERDGHTEYFNTFKCCVCDVKTDVADDHIPLRIRKELREKL